LSRSFYADKTNIKYIPPLGRGRLTVWVEQDGRRIAEEVRIDTSSLVTIRNGKTVEIEITHGTASSESTLISLSSVCHG
jgi:hypothetical protein